MIRQIISLTLSLQVASALTAADSSVIKERFFTNLDIANNIDSIAVWHAPDSSERWLIATAKSSHKLYIYDALNGYPISEYGAPGTALGQFQRPNGIAAVDDLLFVVERDNHRIQALSLPNLKPLQIFGQDALAKPYGIYVTPASDGSYSVYVSDDYNTDPMDDPEPNPDGIKKRVKRFELTRNNGAMPFEVSLAHSFGEHEGEPTAALNVVESLLGDPSHNRLLVADEDEQDGQELHVFTFDGTDTGARLGKGLFAYQPEGIALWETGEKTGYWICTDQGKQQNRFHIFDRESLEYLATFEGERTLNTDGVAIDFAPSERYPMGLFYAIEFDSGVAAFSLEDIAKACALE